MGIDTETTGTNPSENCIHQIAILTEPKGIHLTRDSKPTELDIKLNPFVYDDVQVAE